MKTLALLLCVSAFACAQPSTAPVSQDAIVAEVDGKKYTAKQVDQLMASFPPQMQASARTDPKRALGLLLMMRTLAADAEKANLDKESPLKEQLEYNRVQALSQAQVNQVRNFEVKITPDDEQRYYKEHLDLFQEAKVRVIYIAFTSPGPASKDQPKAGKALTEAEAKIRIEELAKQVRTGADFGKLAKENSDDKDSAAKDGDFGVIRRASPYPEPIKAAVFSLKPGQVSEPLRQPNGFYLLRVESIVTQAFADIRTQIFDDLKQKGFADYMQNLQKRYEVKVQDPAYFAPKSGAALPTQAR